MTRFSPNLRINELKIFARGKVAFNERFHSGLNIIRGQNSSGKSTIMDFLFYGLGGDLLQHQWRETAANCDSVMIEVSINGNILTLWRDVETASLRPMRLFYGAMNEATDSAAEKWESYPFIRSSRESFSQVLFRFLGLPEVEYGESNARLTMNQVLRLIYSDQMSPVEKIFRPQRGDLAVTRQAVGNMLCGAYNDEYYKALIRKRNAVDEFRDVSSQISTMTRIHGKEGKTLTAEWVASQERELRQELSELSRKIEELESQIFNTEFTDRLTLNDQQTARAQVIKLQEEIGKVEQDLTKENLSKEDTLIYISSLDRKLEELKQSKVVAETIGGLTFSFCPSCFAPVNDEEVEGACSLCKNAYDKEEAQKRVLKLVNEYARQKDRAQKIQDERAVVETRLRSRLNELKELWEQASRHYTVSLRNPTSELRAELRDLNRKAGYAYREMEDVARDKAIVTELAELITTKNNLQAELDQLDAIIERGKQRQKTRIESARFAIEKQALDFLKRDLSRQSTFESAEHVTFEFDSDRLAVNDESYFSASSMVYLRNSFFASFLFAAADDKEFLHPRLLLLDTVEDKGMEPERSQNFQLLLHEKSKKALSEHQIIIATSMIAPDLDIPEITVGDTYTHDHRTLRIEA